MGAEERVKKAGFRKQNESGGDSCLFCDYYSLSSDKKIKSCEMHRIRFWDNFEAGGYVCNRFEEGLFDSLIGKMKTEQ